ncbi:MAG: energy transducer TonB [Pseudomonadota bacterium]
MHHLRALAVMVLGSAVVFSSLTLMNRGAEAPEEADDRDEREIDVAPPPPPEPEMEQPEPEPKSEPESGREPPPPGLGSDLGGADVGLGGFDMDGMGDMDEGADEGDPTMTGDTVDEPPEPRSQGELPYPPEAKRDGITGYVVLNLLINAEGEVEKVQVLEAEPEGVFEEAAREAVENWRFTPARYEGRDVRVWARQRIRFDLS